MISKGIKWSYKKDSSQFVDLTDLQEIPDLGGTVESVEITTLADAAHKYEEGLISYGDTLSFKFLYAKEQFNALDALDAECEWKVTLPDTSTCTFSGKGSVKLDGVGVNAALTYTLNIKPASEMIWA